MQVVVKCVENCIPYYYYYYCGVKEFGNPGPLYTKPKAHAEEEEMSENERRKSNLTRNLAEDNPLLGQPRSWKGRAAHHQR